MSCSPSCAPTPAPLRSERLRSHRDRAAEYTAAADTETRAYAAAYRDIRARGWFTPGQLRALGFPAPRTRTRRAKPGGG